MARESEVTYELVCKACFEILARGERPARPGVQEILATDRYIGRKGSTQLVQKFLNDFWASMGSMLQVPARSVEGIPDAYVAILDKALVEMVAVARQKASDELAEKANALEQRAQEMTAAVQAAREAATAADQLRVRAEGELMAVQGQLSDLRSSLNETEQRLKEEIRRADSLQSTIDEKDAELRGQFASLEAVNRAQEQANELHRKEVQRLMLQIDDERQAAKKDGLQQAESLEVVRKEAAALREELVRVTAEGIATQKSKTILENSLAELKGQFASTQASLQALRQELAVMGVRYETAEGLRQEAVSRVTAQAEELGELRNSNEQLARRLDALKESEKNKAAPKKST